MIATDAGWFNLLLHRIFYQYYESGRLLGHLKESIEKQFAKLPLPSFIQPLNLKEIYFGVNLPIVSNIKVIESNSTGACKVTADAEYHGGFSMQLEVVVSVKFLNTERVVPFSLTGTIKHISAKMIVSLAGPPSEVLWLGFTEEPKIDVVMDTEIGLSDITHTFGMTACPKRVGDIITQLLKYQIFSEMVSPHMESIPLPKPNNTVKRNRYVNWRWESEAAKNSIIKLRKPAKQMKAMYNEDTSPTLDRIDNKEIKSNDRWMPTVSSPESSPETSRRSSLSVNPTESQSYLPVATPITRRLSEDNPTNTTGKPEELLTRTVSQPQPLPTTEAPRIDLDSLTRRHQSITSSGPGVNLVPPNHQPAKSSFDNVTLEFAEAIGLTSEDVENVKTKFIDVWKRVTDN